MSVCMKGGEFLDHMSDCQLPKEYPGIRTLRIYPDPPTLTLKPITSREAQMEISQNLLVH
jgi:hypothetical protein